MRFSMEDALLLMVDSVVRVDMSSEERVLRCTGSLHALVGSRRTGLTTLSALFHIFVGLKRT